MSWTDRLLAPWDRLDEAGRRQATAVLLCGALFLVHFTLYSSWYIEDAAISFGYARHFAEGDGFVTYPGGEPVEGFSNPTWTLAMAALHTVGIGPFVSAKLLGAVLGLAGLPLAWRWARNVMGPREDLAPTLAPLLLALSPQYVLWCASGLENSAVTVTMAAGGAALTGEILRRRAVPWSGLWFSLLAISRPEAPAYAAIAALVGFGGVLFKRGPTSALDWAWRWALLAAGPFAAWHAFAYVHFAWEVPNTYFAKLSDGNRFQPWIWSGKRTRGWGYLRKYAMLHGHGFLLWLYALGMTGTRGLRSAVGLLLIVAVYLVCLPGIVWLWSVWGEAPLDGMVPALGAKGALPLWPFAPDPEWLVTLRVIGLGVVAALLPLLGAGRQGQAGRILAGWLCGFILFFSLYAGGDWMDGFRWLNLCSVPMAVLLADASVRLYDHAYVRLPGRWLPWLAAVPVTAVAILSVVHSVDRIRGPETSPFDVGRRVHYLTRVADRLDLPMEDVVWMDVDMGAHLWWAGPTSPIVDMAGLVDVPMGHHAWEKEFVGEYVYDERKPDFAHVHGSWASKTRMRSHRGWRDYIEIAPFPVSPKRTHDGNHVHERHLKLDKWEGRQDRRARWGGLELVGWDVPAPVVAPGETLQVEVGWRRVSTVRASTRALMVLSGQDRLVSRELPLAYDWIPVEKWRRSEILRGDHRFTLPSDLPVGDYDLAIVVLDPRGVHRATRVPSTGTIAEPVYAQGEIRWEGVVQIRDEAGVDAAANAGLAEVLGEGDCAFREARWDAVRHHRPPDHPWTARAKGQASTALARCWASSLERGLDEGAGAEELVARGRLARRWNHRDAEVRRVTGLAADRLQEASEEAEARGDVDAAYARARDALWLRPYDGWARRRAERLRDTRLGLETPPTPLERLERRVRGLVDGSDPDAGSEDR